MSDESCFGCDYYKLVGNGYICICPNRCPGECGIEPFENPKLLSDEEFESIVSGLLDD